jgi:membrane-bound ClpP family serine protease
MNVMTILGTPIETIYLIVLIVSGSLTLLYILFGDVFHGIGEALNFLHPALVLAFLTFFSASGYILEMVTPFSSLVIMVVSILLALVLDTLLNLFVLIPLSSAEESLAYTEDSLKGRVGKTIISIPENGFGEVILESSSGTIAKPAASYRNESIEEGMQVLVIEVNSGVLYVVRYENHQLHDVL